jgi:hypothetical protein
MKGSFIKPSATKDPFINAAPPQSAGRASPHHELSACHPVDLAKPDHAVSKGPMHEARHCQKRGGGWWEQAVGPLGAV